MTITALVCSSVPRQLHSAIALTLERGWLRRSRWPIWDWRTAILTGHAFQKKAPPTMKIGLPCRVTARSLRLCQFHARQGARLTQPTGIFTVTLSHRPRLNLFRDVALQLTLVLLERPYHSDEQFQQRPPRFPWWFISIQRNNIAFGQPCLFGQRQDCRVKVGYHFSRRA